MPSILVIDDDDIMLKAIKNILHKDGFEVLTAKDGKEAFEKLDNATYDIVITDLMMPYANGLEVVSKLRNDDSKGRVGIIIVSSVGNDETISEAFRLGADDYIRKPIMAENLLKHIRQLLENKNNKTQFITKKQFVTKKQ
jgi:DNA-binding response OmpR family regulator